MIPFVVSLCQLPPCVPCYQIVAHISDVPSHKDYTYDQVVSLEETLPCMVRALESLGLHSQAEAKLKQLVNLRTHSWGAGHQLTIEALLQLGACVDAQRRGEEALQIYKAVLDVEESQHGHQHPLVAISCFYVASQCDAECKELEQGLASAQRALDIAAKVYPAGHTFITEILRVQGGLCDRLGQPEEAARTWKRAMKNLVIGESRILDKGDMSIMKELQARLASSVSALSQMGRGSLLMLDRPSEPAEHNLLHTSIRQSARSPSRQGGHNAGRSSSRQGPAQQRRTPSSRTGLRRAVPAYISEWHESAWESNGSPSPANGAAESTSQTTSPDFEKELKKWRNTDRGGSSKAPQALQPSIVGSTDQEHRGERGYSERSGSLGGSSLPSFHAHNASRQARQAAIAKQGLPGHFGR